MTTAAITEQSASAQLPSEKSSAFLDLLDNTTPGTAQNDPAPITPPIIKPVKESIALKDDPKKVVEKPIEKSDQKDDDFNPFDTSKTVAAEIPVDPKEQGKTFKALRERAEKAAELEKQLAERDGKIKEYEPLKEEVEKYKKQLSDYEQTLSVIKIEATQQYQEKFGKPIEQIESRLVEIGKKYQVSQAELLHILSIEDSETRENKLDELSIAFTPKDQARLSLAVDQFMDVKKGAAEIKANAKAHYNLLLKQQAEQRAILEKQSSEDFVKAVDENWKEMEKVYPIMRKSENENHKKFLTDLREYAIKAYTDPNVMGDKNLLSRLLLHAGITSENSRYAGARIQYLETELKKYVDAAQAQHKAAPGAGPGNKAAVIPSGESSPKTFTDMLDKMGQ